MACSIEFSLDSTVIKVHPDGLRTLKNGTQSVGNGTQSVGNSCGGWTTKLHLIAATAECAVMFFLSPGQVGVAPEGRRLLTELGAASEPCAMIMDQADEGDETRKLVAELEFSPVVPPKSSRTEPWESMTRSYIKNGMKLSLLFRNLKRFRRVFSRFDKLDRMLMSFVVLALIVIASK